ncbi:general substrate transporter [Rhizopogon salebrosus TDB-379]|nr:general substrate transporter [Rhizopogon salebrosus TDB-379]
MHEYRRALNIPGLGSCRLQQVLSRHTRMDAYELHLKRGLQVHDLPIGWVAIMLALVASMGGFIFGYDTGQISDVLLMDDFLLRFATCSTPGDVSTCRFSNVREGLIVAILSIGTLCGALLGAPIADLLGRRYAMSVDCLVFIIGIFVQICSGHVWQQFSVGRFISGLGVGALSVTVPMYQAETAPRQIRGTLIATYQLFITFGILVAYCVSIITRNVGGSASWRIVVGFSILWAMVLGTGILFMPESPRWLAVRGRMDKALESLAHTHGISKEEATCLPVVAEEIAEITFYVRHEENRSGWIDCFRLQDKTLYRTLLGMSLQSLQQLSGANYFFYYGATVFKSVGLSDPFMTQFILGAVNFFCTFGGMYVLEKFGRRRPLIIGGIWQSTWLFIFAYAGTMADPTSENSIGKLMIVSACMFVWGFSMTWGPGIWIIVGEIFPTRTRAKQGSLSTAANWVWNFLLAFFTPFISSAIHYRYGYVPAACNLVGVVVVYFFLYESSHISLENVDNMYTDPNCKPWTSRGWSPT